MGNLTSFYLLLNVLQKISLTHKSSKLFLLDIWSFYMFTTLNNIQYRKQKLTTNQRQQVTQVNFGLLHEPETRSGLFELVGKPLKKKTNHKFTIAKSLNIHNKQTHCL